MIRIIVQEDEIVPVADGGISRSYRTFLIDVPELEAHLRTGNQYYRVSVVGAEIVEEPER